MMYLKKTVRNNLLIGALGIACMTVAYGAYGEAADPVVAELDQAWTNVDRELWYAATQGSRLLPMAWFSALEKADSSELFLSPSNMASFGYLAPGDETGSLPLGFAIDRGPDLELGRTKLRWKEDQGPDEPWVGLNCSACHTSQLSYRGKTIRLDGGPSISNFQAFVEALDAALVATRDDPGKWGRFTARLFPSERERARNDLLTRQSFSQLVGWQLIEQRANRAALIYGPGRVDAFGHILNKIALTLDPTFTGNPSDAPVSIPFIWRAPQYDKVQYNGIAPKIMVPATGVDVGALARNTGEVIGVFGDIVPSANLGLTDGFASSLKTRNMLGLEELLTKLRPPAWPVSVFGPIDQRMKEKGAILFEEHCSSCHMTLARTDLATPVRTEMSLFDGTGINSISGEILPAPGTDPWMACNTYAYMAKSGVFENYSSLIFTKNKTVTRTYPSSELLKLSVIFTLVGKEGDIIKEVGARFFSIDRPPILESNIPTDLSLPESRTRSGMKIAQAIKCGSEKNENLGYTSRPLNGVWATAPFLHNGSVATIYDLLLPASKRKSFSLGTREYDPIKLGFAPSSSDSVFQYKIFDDAGEPIDGNWNGGHDYNNAGLDDDDRFALIEYLKSI